MNNKVLVIVLCFLFLVFSACDKPDSPPAAGTAPAGTRMNPVQEGGNSQKPENRQAMYGFVIRAPSGIYTIEQKDGRDTAKYADSINLGEKVEILNKGQVKKAFYDAGELEFIEVRRDTGKTGFLISYQLALGGSLAVVTYQTANIYKTAKNIDVTSFIISPKTVLVVYPETEQSGFIRFSAYDPVLKRYFSEQYVKISVISLSEQDIQSSILLQLALLEKQPVRREALLKSALDDYPASIFMQEINDILYPPVKEEQPSSAGTLYINDDKINVRSSPDELNGTVITQLDKGSPVNVDRETRDAYSVGESFAKWYHINNPAEGWVFGAFLDSAPPAEKSE